MPGPGRLVAICALIASTSDLAFADTTPSPVAPAVESATEQLIRDLGSPVYGDRDRATKALWKMGERARTALSAAALSGDPEVAQRALDILDKFDWGFLPGTPPEVYQQIRAFRTGDPTAQQVAVAALIRLGEPGVPVLRLLLSKDSAPDYREPLFEYLSWTLRREVPRLLLAGQQDRAEDLLALNTLGTSQAGLIDYAVFVQLRGRSRAAAAELESVRASGGTLGEAAARALVFLYRAAGEPARARALAAEVEKTDPAFREVHESLLEDTGAWNELTARSSDGQANSRDGLAAFRLRLAGRAGEAAAILNRQKDQAHFEAPRSGGVDPATLALLLNDRSLEGIERLRGHGNAPHILADLLATRMEFAESLGLVGGNPGPDGAPVQDAAFLGQLYGARRGRLLWQLGKRVEAAEVFGQVAGQMGADGSALTPLIRAEVRAGRFDLACEHLGRVLAAADPDGGRGSAAGRQDGFEVLFETDAGAAAHWWRVLRRSRPEGEAPGTTMRKVRALLTGTAPPADLAAALRAIETVATDYADPLTLGLAAAAVYRAAGRPADAADALARTADRLRAPTPMDLDDDDQARRYGRGTRAWVFGTDERFRFWMELGDLLGELGRHREAAARFEQGWQRFPDNPVLLYLCGQALVKAGDEKEGRRRIELSHWVTLGNARLRGRFLEELTTRGLAPDARRERDLAREAGWMSELYIGNVWNQVARASVMLKDFPAAADAHRRAIHYLLRTPGVTYVEGQAYLTVPQAVRASEARGLLAAGRVDEALALARECLAVMPGNTDLVIGMVPELEKLGRSKEADELFRLVWTAYAAVLRDYPESGWARYSAAWLAAGCRRELSAGLEHAARAVEMEPGKRSYQEALAEVHFRRGDRDRAVAIMKELASSDRRSHHYRRQLERYQSGDPASPVPEDSGE